MTSTEHSTAIEKSSVLLEALPYIRRFQGAIFVIKYGGAFMDDADSKMCARVATDIAFLHAVGIKVVVVHGGGKAITRALAEAKVETRFEHGLRVTDAETVRIVERTLNRTVNPEICRILRAGKAKPFGITGDRVLFCDKKEVVVDGVKLDLGFVGEIRTVQIEPIEKALDDGCIPVISPIACDASGQIHNTNADAAAGHIATALRARRLVYLCDVPGIMRNGGQAQSLVSSLKADEVAGLVADGTIRKGMIPKTDSAVAALKGGVHRVHLIAGSQPHSLLLEIFTDQGIGTEIVNH